LNKITPSSYIYTMSNIEGINIWMSLYFDEEKNRWKGSIRSIKEDISVIAAKFDGGGHKLASGFSLNDNKEFKLVIKEVISLLHN
jgi:phosphoesterase RecJ-like protein